MRQLTIFLVMLGCFRITAAGVSLLNASSIDELEVYNGIGSSLQVSSDGSALVIDYSVSQNASWGGTASARLAYETFRDCTGSAMLRFRFNVLVAQSASGRASLRLVLADGSACGGACDSSLAAAEHYYSFWRVLDDAAGWQELTTEFRGGGASSGAPFERTGWYGVAGDQEFDADQLAGLTIELSIDGAGAMGSSSTGQILVSDVSCFNPPSPASPPLSPSPTPPPPSDPPLATPDPAADAILFSAGSLLEASRLGSSRLSYTETGSGALLIDYDIVQDYSWGGSAAITASHASPSDASLPTAGGSGRPLLADCSGHSFARVRANVLIPQSAVGRVGLRVIIVDASNCLLANESADGTRITDCGSDFEAAEYYYSFLPILDESQGWQDVEIELRGGSSSDLPFWRTGWHGATGNDILDVDSIVRVTVELAIVRARRPVRPWLACGLARNRACSLPVSSHCAFTLAGFRRRDRQPL